MATRLTGFSKFIITLIILGAIVYAGWYMLNRTEFGQQLKKDAQQEVEANNNSNNDGSVKNEGRTAKSSNKNDDNTLKVQLVTWGGYAPGLFYNKGAAANELSGYFKNYGFKVDFKLENDLGNALSAWMTGEYDVLVQTADAFPLYTSSDDINAYKPKVIMQVDWSRGGDAIIAKRGINSINDLKGKNVVVAVPSPAQTMLITALEAAGMSYNDVKVIETSDNLKAAQLFRSAEVDVAVVWSPDDVIATQDVPGSKILLTTRDMSHIIGDIMFAKADFIEQHPNMINGFYEGWMKGVSAIKTNQNNRKQAAQYLAEMNELGVEDALGMMDNVYFTGHGDNLNFLGLNSSYKGHSGGDLYNKMNKKFAEIGTSEKMGSPWRSVVYTGAAKKANVNLTGSIFDAEKDKSFTAPTKKQEKKAPIATKPVSINFASGQYQLTENAKTIIDLQFSDVAKSFANTRIRIEGNTDNVGSRSMNMKLSGKRALAVKQYLQSAYKIKPNRFITIGNGQDNPVKGCETNATKQCKAKNRRTEFQLISD